MPQFSPTAVDIPIWSCYTGTVKKEEKKMDQFSEEVLEGTPERVTKFLSGLGAVALIRTSLHQAGMTNEDIIEGRTLLLDCLAAPLETPLSTDTKEAKSAREAMVEIDRSDEHMFARVRSALNRYFPSASEFVFYDLKAGRRVQSVQAMSTFLARLEAMEQGTDPARADMREQDRQAIELLHRRGITPEVRERMARLVQVALGPTPALPELPALNPEERRTRLVALKLWFDDWSGTARAVVNKRSHLIRLGLARRRSPRAGGETGTDE